MSKNNARNNLLDGKHLPGVGRQDIEANPLTDDEVAMFEMFEREGWSPERRREHIHSLIGGKKADPAVE